MNPCYPVRRPMPPEMPECGSGYLMQRILAGGQRVFRPAELCLCPNQLPCAAQAPFTVLEAGVIGCPQWQEIPCRRRDALALLVNVRIALRLRDACGACFSVETGAEEELLLRCRCPVQDCWRGQIVVQAAVRPYRSRGCRCRGDERIPVEMLLEGFLLSPCTVNCPGQPACPDQRPLYPEPPCCGRSF